MLLNILIFGILIAFVIAKLEINIEGKNGWAENLPTWRRKNFLTKMIWGELPITGYHLWFLAMIEIFLHFPFVTGATWSIGLELQIQAMFLLATVIEDFFWFVLNPEFGFKKFNKFHARWHEGWVGPVPYFYLRLLSLSGLFLAISLYTGTRLS